MAEIKIDKVSKSFGKVTVLKEFDSVFRDGEFITFLGPSGCGKTTMLRIIAGFEKPTTGSVSIDGKVVSSKDVFVPPEKRGIGMVFQSYAVWPHMNVFDNVAYPLKIQKVPKDEIKTRVEKVLETVHLKQYADRVPAQLSGGQQQRVSIARALVRNPPVILADEPTGALDSHTGREVLGLLQQLHKQGHTVVLITHDNSIAVQADRIIRLEDGQVVYDGDSHAPEAMVQPTLLPETPEKEEQA